MEGSGELVRQDFRLCATLYGTTTADDSEDVEEADEVLDDVEAELGVLSSGWKGVVGVSGSGVATVVLIDNFELDGFGAGNALMNVFRPVGVTAEIVSNRIEDDPTLLLVHVLDVAWAVLVLRVSFGSCGRRKGGG